MTDTGGKGSDGRAMVGATEFDTVERREAEMVGGPGVLPELGS
jgi:hypothetical protein